MNEIDKMVQDLRKSFTYADEENLRTKKLVMAGFFSLLVLFAYWYLS